MSPEKIYKEKFEWIKTLRPSLEWVDWDPKLNVQEYADRIIKRTKVLNCNAIIYPWESGGYLLYPGDLAPQYRNLKKGQDLLGTLIKKAHKNNLKFIVCFLGISGNAYMTENYPEWVQRDSKEQLIQKWPGYNFRSMCQNSPYTDYLCKVAKDLLTRYPLDGIYMEGIYVAPGFCHCDYCKKYYREKYGKEIRTEYGGDKDAKQMPIQETDSWPKPAKWD